MTSGGNVPVDQLKEIEVMRDTFKDYLNIIRDEMNHIEELQNKNLKRKQILDFVNSNSFHIYDTNGSYYEKLKSVSTEELRKHFPKIDFTKDFQIHHIIPRCLGGLNEKYNLIPLPSDIHSNVHKWFRKS